MFPEVNSALDIKTCGCILGKSVCISESDADGTFLIHHFLSFFLRNDQPACFVALSQSFNHFNTVSKKMGLDLNVKRDKGQLRFVEGLKLLGEVLTEDKGLPGSESIGDNPFLKMGQSPHRLSALYFHIENISKLLMDESCKPPVIVFDNLNILLNVGYTVKDIIALVKYLQTFVDQHKGTMILHINKGSGSCDEEAVLIWNYLQHCVHLKIEVCGLDSGYCKDVHGECKFSWDDSLQKKSLKKTMQFKLTDKTIALFAAGMSSAVL